MSLVLSLPTHAHKQLLSQESVPNSHLEPSALTLSAEISSSDSNLITLRFFPLDPTVQECQRPTENSSDSPLHNAGSSWQV